MPKAKTENYTAEMTATMIERYEAVGEGVTEADHDARAEVVKELAAEFKKSERSIRSKLVREEVYIKRGETSTVTGEKPEKKEVIAARLVAAVGDVTIDGKVRKLNADSLAKANKTDLSILLYVFNSEIVDEATDENETDSPEESGEASDSES
jgi:hypothetical protein